MFFEIPHAAGSSGTSFDNPRESRQWGDGVEVGRSPDDWHGDADTGSSGSCSSHLKFYIRFE